MKARYDRGLTAGVRLAKEHLRYAVHRTNEHGQRQYREVWARGGTLSKQTAYERLDGAGPRDYVYRLTLSPHPERQDAGQRLDLREWGRAMMARLEAASGQLARRGVTGRRRDRVLGFRLAGGKPVARRAGPSILRRSSECRSG